MQVTAARGGAAAAAAEDEPEGAASGTASGAAAVGAAKRRLVAAMMKKFVAEELLPVLLELRTLLQASQTPCGRVLQAALLALLQEHKAEVRSLCSANND